MSGGTAPPDACKRRELRELRARLAADLADARVLHAACAAAVAQGTATPEQATAAARLGPAIGIMGRALELADDLEAGLPAECGVGRAH